MMNIITVYILDITATVEDLYIYLEGRKVVIIIDIIRMNIIVDIHQINIPLRFLLLVMITETVFMILTLLVMMLRQLNEVVTVTMISITPIPLFQTKITLQKEFTCVEFHFE